MKRRLVWLGLGATAFGCGEPVSAVSGLQSSPVDSADPFTPEEPDEPTETQPEEEPPSSVISMTREGMVEHLEALMAIAEANDGNRAAGTSGYDASVSYVSDVLEAAGYTVSLHEFEIQEDVWHSPPAVEAGRSMAMEEDFYPFGYTGSGVVTAAVDAVDISIPPPDGENTTSSGCEREDFAGFTPGRIALMQRGSCTFQEKVDHAIEAGAVGALIFNEGQPGRRDVFAGTLDSESENPLPVFALSYDAGVEISELASGTEVSISADFGRIAVPTVNISYIT